MKLKRISTDRLIGVSAMVISLLTLIIFIYQTNIMREQSKLSVKPRLDFTLNSSIQDTTLILQEVVQNKGLGPAIIDSIYFKYKEDSYEVDTEKFLKQKFPKNPKMGLPISTCNIR
ncbi:hypothetical protein ACFSQJ_18680 [Croceitalea marina]|uniref:Uncharacterized protein n=1 Tax=Croceitalea marina TaxID=1775166 RepID=A0ABW5N1C0_9FLAO